MTLRNPKGTIWNLGCYTGIQTLSRKALDWTPRDPAWPTLEPYLRYIFYHSKLIFWQKSHVQKNPNEGKIERSIERQADAYCFVFHHWNIHYTLRASDCLCVCIAIQLCVSSFCVKTSTHASSSCGCQVLCLESAFIEWVLRYLRWKWIFSSTTNTYLLTEKITVTIWGKQVPQK